MGQAPEQALNATNAHVNSLCKLKETNLDLLLFWLRKLLQIRILSAPERNCFCIWRSHSVLSPKIFTLIQIFTPSPPPKSNGCCEHMFKKTVRHLLAHTGKLGTSVHVLVCAHAVKRARPPYQVPWVRGKGGDSSRPGQHNRYLLYMLF